MEVIYNNILDDIQEHIDKAAINNRTVKRLILTPREFGEIKKQLHKVGNDVIYPWSILDWKQKILGIPFEIK